MTFSDIAPYLGAAGYELRDLDPNTKGADDYAAALLIYLADLSTALTNDEPLPDLPEILLQGTREKLGKHLLITLRIARAGLTIAQFKVPGLPGQILRYAVRAISQLIEGRPVLPFPEELADRIQRLRQARAA